MHVNEAFNKRYITIIGGLISGSEAVSLLAEKGFKVCKGIIKNKKIPIIMCKVLKCFCHRKYCNG